MSEVSYLIEQGANMEFRDEVKFVYNIDTV